MSDAPFPTQANEAAPTDGYQPAPAVGDDDADLLHRFQAWHRQATDHRRDYRQEAADMLDIVAGHQWAEEDLMKLREDLRPAVTFNRVGPFIDGVSGLEISNRQEARYIPRQIGSAGVNDLLTAAEKWVRDDCDAEDEESEAFRDALICGEGWTQTLIQYDQDPDGLVKVERIDPLEMLPDSASTKGNYADARWIMREKDMPIEAAREMAPDADDEDLDAVWAKDAAEHADDPHDARAAPFYRNDQSGRGLATEKEIVRLVEVEWWEIETAYRVADPSTGGLVRLSESEHRILQTRAKAMGITIQSVKDRRRCYWRALVGNKVLTKTKGPDQGGFTYKAITGKRDRRGKCWYGMVRPMKDPQQWANKWLSQTLHIMNSNAKGGLLAESDAFENPHEAEDTWSDPSAITLLAPGGMSKIQPKPAITFPAGLDRLMEYAVSAIPGVTGFSPEMMGMVDRTQPGVVEQGRKQQGMVLLAGFFNSLRRYRKEQGRLMLWFIQTFISDGRLVRVGGPDDAKYVQLARDKTLGEYDVVVDDTPTSPNMKERVWGSLVQMFPVFSRLNLPPTVYLEFLKYSPLPATLIQKLSVMAQQAQQQAQGQPDPHKAALIAKDQANANLANAKAQAEQSKIQVDMTRVQLEQQLQQADIEQKRALAIAALGKLGMDQDAAALQRATIAMQALLDVHQSALAGQQQTHDQALDLAQHQLAAQQAAQQPQQ